MFKKRSKRVTAALVLLLLVALFGLTTSVSAGDPPPPSPSDGSGCYDTDGGSDPWVKGTVTLPGKAPFTDYCSDPYCGLCSDCTECVAEGYCYRDKEGEYILRNYVSCAKLGAVCQNGRCVPIAPEPEPEPKDRMVTVTGTTAWPETQLRLFSIDLRQPFWQPFSAGADGHWGLYGAGVGVGLRVCTVDREACSGPITPARKFWWGIHLH